MNITDLITKLQEEIDEIDLSRLTPNTVILEIEGWNSLYSLIVMALASTEYDVELPAEDMRSIKTVQDLFNTIQRLKAA